MKTEIIEDRETLNHLERCNDVIETLNQSQEM